MSQLKEMGLKKSAQSSLTREEAGQVLDAVANDAALADVPGIATAGAWADGVGVPAVIAGARAAAQALVS